MDRARKLGAVLMALMTPVAHLVPQIDARLVWFCAALLGIDALFIAVFSIHEIYVLLYNDREPLLGNEWISNLIGHMQRCSVI